MEGKMLLVFNFDLTSPSPLVFLERYKKLIQIDEKGYMLAKYLCEL